VKPLVHPSIDDITVEGVLHALSDPVRAQIFVQIARASTAQTCSTFLEVRDRPVPKSTVSQHFRALREAGLIRSERQGVEMHSTSRCAEIATRFPGLIEAILRAHEEQQSHRSRRKRR
jgi:DNA-binding transcriptional ArsR family regulator